MVLNGVTRKGEKEGRKKVMTREPISVWMTHQQNRVSKHIDVDDTLSQPCWFWFRVKWPVLIVEGCWLSSFVFDD